MKLHSETRRHFSTTPSSTPSSIPSTQGKTAGTLALLILGIWMLSACESKADFSYSNGSTGQYADFAGKWLVINYWAEWCKPCIKELPELNQFAAANVDKDVYVIGVNYDIMPVEQEQAIIAKLNIEFPIARASLHEHYGYAMPMSLPTTIVISPEGKVHKVLQGPQTVATLTESVRP